MPKKYESYKVSELREKAKLRNIKGIYKMNKTQLITSLRTKKTKKGGKAGGSISGNASASNIIDIKHIIQFIKSNPVFFYKNISDFYMKNMFDDRVTDGVSQRAVFLGMNEGNCRYNSCLLFTIIMFMKSRHLTIEELIKESNYIDFIELLCNNFSNGFFHICFQCEKKEEINISDNNYYIIRIVGVLDGHLQIKHMCVLFKNIDKFFILDAYANNKGYKRGLEYREIKSKFIYELFETKSKDDDKIRNILNLSLIHI